MQILTIAIALSTSFLAVLMGVFLNNNRLNDVKELLGAKIEASRAGTSLETEVLRAEMKAERAEINGRFDRVEMKLEKIDDNIARILADHEHRLTRLEGSKN